ncbi:1,4-dihydroxy-2-naphthoate octaprenyltransferase [Aliiroseovarius subalbicans]|uniref:1,4-dihydroxy-2-naphthoate octaprenyltransferase n=1 Tax=Aliiroseovarius subalbicans TaxID=2925840 RepID=UPI001F55B96E|nr:1,4-dihydroxy-2-naphthoate octaprenyltransferase [Aliiroseovarius subalbicans]MCI2399613.1 1,4-dihydroxy-2-naphthoate octaprenyltransferase [Aliiroseovarius subalbicans]
MGTTSIDPATLARLEALPPAVRWVIAARIKTLGLSLTPVAAGSWLAASLGGWTPWVTAVAMGASVAIQIGTNLWNDAGDGARGVDGPDRLGPLRLTALGLLNPSQVRRAAAAVFGVAVLLGLFLVALGGWPIVAIGGTSLALGFFYSMGPHPLSATPLGELLVITFFGVVAVAGTMHLHGARVDAQALHLGVVVGLPASAVLLLNNHRDRVTDARAGRRTLAILLGQGASKVLYALLLLLSVVLAGLFSGAWLTLLPAALLGGGLVGALVRLPLCRTLNRLIPGTGVFQILLLLGLVGGAIG